jgi:hypothetical protein
MALSIETQNGKRITVEADSALIGRDSACQIALPDEANLQPIHAKIRKVADRWMIEAQGDWQIQVGTGLPGRMSWLKPGDVIRLTEAGPEITFGEVQPSFNSPEERVPKKSQPSAPIPESPKEQAPEKPRPVDSTPTTPPDLPARVDEWFYARDGKKCGPFSPTQFKQLAGTGVLHPEDLVWKTGMAKWVPAISIPALFPNGSPVPSPPTPPPMPRIPAPETPQPQVVTAPKNQPSATILPSDPPKDPILMAVLSFFVPWMGQILIGQVAKGVVMLLVTPILFALFVIVTLGMGLVILPFVGVIAVIDAYLLSKKLKDGQAIGGWEFFGIESASSLAMPDLLPKANDSSGKSVEPGRLRPPGLVGSAVGMLFVSGLAMMISILGVVGIVVNERMPTVMQIFIALSFIHNAWVIFAIVQTLRMQRYAFAITAPLLVIASWCWLTFSGLPIGMSVMGILGGISVGIWSLGVLRQPEVRAAFANQYDPLETLLPMAKATLEEQSSDLGAIKGLFKQLVTSKIALGIAGVVLLCLLAVPLFSLLGPSQHKSKFLGDSPKDGGDTQRLSPEVEAKLKQAVADGDELYEAGLQSVNESKKPPYKTPDRNKFDEAYERYMVVVNAPNPLPDKAVMARVYGRVIDVAASRLNNKTLAREVAMKSLRQEILPVCKSPEASSILDVARRALKAEGKEIDEWLENQEKDGGAGDESGANMEGGKKKDRDSPIAGKKADDKYMASGQDSKPPSKEVKPKQPQPDDKKKVEAIPAKEITLTPAMKAVYTHVTEYGGRLFADGARQDSPIVAVRAFGFGQDTKKLTGLPSLEHLDLRGKLVTQKMSNFDPASLTQFKNLKTLALGQISPKDLSHLAAIETLETVCFDVDVGGKRAKGVTLNDVVQASLAEVAKVKHLKHLRIGNGGSSFASHPANYTAIPTCPELQYLETWLTCDDAAMSAISKSKTLKKLVIVFPKNPSGKTTFTAKGLADLATAPSLSSVQVSDADDALCEGLAQLPNVKELIVAGSVTKSCLTRVASKHPDLRILTYREAFKPPFAEPRDNWMQVLPPNRWRQVMFSKKKNAFVLGPFETNNTENYFDGSL